MSFSLSKLGVSFVASLKSRKNVKRKPYFWKLGAPLSHLRLSRRTFLLLGSSPTSDFLLKPIIPLRTYPKKSKKRQAKTLLLKIRNTPIALAALAADFSSFSVPPLYQVSFENQWFSKDSRSNLWSSLGKAMIFIDSYWNLEVSYEKPMICQDYRSFVWFSFENLMNFLRFNLACVTHSDLHFREA